MKNGPDSILSVVHETAKGLRDAGIMNEITMIALSRQSGGIRCLPEREQNICGELGVGRKETRPCGSQAA